MDSTTPDEKPKRGMRRKVSGTISPYLGRFVGETVTVVQMIKGPGIGLGQEHSLYLVATENGEHLRFYGYEMVKVD